MKWWQKLLMILGTIGGLVAFALWLIANADASRRVAEAKVAADNDEEDLEKLRAQYAKQINEETAKVQNMKQAEIIAAFHKAFGGKV